MSMTPTSSKYFQQVSEKWDSIRAGYFSEAVRQAAIDKAYLIYPLATFRTSAST